MAYLFLIVSLFLHLFVYCFFIYEKNSYKTLIVLVHHLLKYIINNIAMLELELVVIELRVTFGLQVRLV